MSENASQASAPQAQAAAPGASSPQADSQAQAAGQAAASAPESSGAKPSTEPPSEDAEAASLLELIERGGAAEADEGGASQETEQTGTVDDDDGAAGAQPRKPQNQQDAEKIADRIRIGHVKPAERAKLIAAMEFLRENPDASLSEALADAGLSRSEAKKIEEQSSEQQQQQQQQERQAEPSELEKTVAKVTELQKAIRDAKANLDDEKEAELMDQLLTENRKLARLELQQETEKQQLVQTFKQNEDESFARVEAAMPDLQTKGTALNQAANERIAWLEQNAPQVFNDPTWLEDVAAHAWRRTNPGKPMPVFQAAAAAEPKGGKPKAEVPPRLPAKPGVPASMAPASGRSGGGDTSSALVAAAESDDPETLLKVIEGRVG